MDLGHRNGVEVAVEHDDVRRLAHLEAPVGGFLVRRVGRIDGIRPEHGGEVGHFLGNPGRSGRIGRAATGDGHLNRLEGVERRYRPVAGGDHLGAALHHGADRVEPARPFRPENRDGQIGDVLVGEGPEGLEARDHAGRLEARDVGRVEQLKVGDDRPAVPGAVRPGGGIDPVEGHPDRAVADGVDVDLDSGLVESSHQGIHLALAEIGDARAAAAVEIRRQEGGRLGLDHAIGKEFGGGRGVVPGALVALSPGNQRIDLGQILLGIDVLGREHPGGHLALPVERGVGLEQLGIGRALMGGGNAELVREADRPDQSALPLLERVGRQELRHQRTGLLPERPRWIAGGVPFDPAVGGVPGGPRDTGNLERFRVDPGGVPVGGGEIDWVVGRHLVQQGLARIGVREHRQRPPSSPDPFTRLGV